MKTYKSIDTGESWTADEIREIYEAEESLKEQYSTFEQYLEYLLELGKQKTGGIIEE